MVAEVSTPVVIRISPMSHIAVGFLALGLLVPVLTWPAWGWPLMLIPIALSTLILRLKTSADLDGVTACGLLSRRTVPWDDIKGLQFEKSAFARAVLKDGEHLRLPAVTFALLPLLTEVSGGRVPNPYS